MDRSVWYQQWTTCSLSTNSQPKLFANGSPDLLMGHKKSPGCSVSQCSHVRNKISWFGVELIWREVCLLAKKHKMFWAPCDTDTRCDLSCKKNKLDLLIVKSFVSSDVQKTASLLQKAYFYFYVHLIVGVGHSQGSMDNLVPGSLCQFNSIQPKICMMPFPSWMKNFFTDVSKMFYEISQDWLDTYHDMKFAK